MIMHQLREAPDPELSAALEAFEKQFRYPLGPGRFFRIDHGADYPRFFRAMGTACCFVAARDGRVVGALGAALRSLLLPDGGTVTALYLGDLKVAPAARGGPVLVRLLQAARAWTGDQTAAAFSVVMDGTTVTPERYTGRLGIPAFGVVGKIAVFRFATTGEKPSGEDLFRAGDEAGGECFRRLSRGRYSSPGGIPEERSEIPPAWLVHPAGLACGRLEDTRRAKRLITQEGDEMASAHLACFAFENPRSGADLIRQALARARNHGLPALFVAVPVAEADSLAANLKDIDTVVAPATIYGAELTTGSWNINSSEI